MGENDALLQRTVKAATRLLKSKIREHLYTTKHKEAGDGDTRWSAMLLVEKTFMGPALREWNGVLDLWDLSTEEARKAVMKALMDAFPIAANEVLSIFDEDQLWAMRKLIEGYHRKLPIDELLVKEGQG